MQTFLLAASLLAASSTTGSSLFSDEALPASDGGGLFSDEALPSDEGGGLFSEGVTASDEPIFEPRVRASVKLDARASVDTSFDRPHEHIFELDLGGSVEVDAEFASGWSVYAQPRFSHVTAIDRDGEDREVVYLEVPEAYVTWSSGRTHLRVGTMIFGWGSSDFVAPADVLNPVDMRRGLLGGTPEQSKIPVFAAELVTSFGPLTVRGVIEPFFTPSRFYLASWDDALSAAAVAQGMALPDLDGLLGAGTVDALADQMLITERPTDRPDDATYALRTTLKLGDLDVSATAVYGWESLPRLTMDPDVAFLAGKLADSLGGGEPLELTDEKLLGAITRLQDATAEGRTVFEGSYERRLLLGLDAVLAIDPILLKFDVAYTFERTLYAQGTFSPVTVPWLNAVVGIEYFDGEELQVIVEAFAITLFDVRSYYRLAIFEPNAPPPSQLDVGGRTIALPGLIGVVRYTIWDGDLSFEIGAVTTLTRGDLIAMPTIKWRLDDEHQLSLGGVLVEGKSDGYGGYYTHNDRVFVGYQWGI